MVRRIKDFFNLSVAPMALLVIGGILILPFVVLIFTYMSICFGLSKICKNSLYLLITSVVIATLILFVFIFVAFKGLLSSEYLNLL